ncbi:MAG: glycosyltransferase family 4 protein [Chloroflexi bacterium]|nr:glycosyltransferase family 4 protein [Chloroflexota bacterium]
MTRPLRVLFLHASRDDANEYTVHRRLARHVDPDKVECYFIWQTATQDPSRDARLNLPKDRAFFIDFGRDQSIQPRPSKAKRALMVLRRFPHTLAFVYRKMREIKPDVIYTTQQRHEVVLAQKFSRILGIPHLIHICYFIGPWLGAATYRLILRNPHIHASCEFVRQTGIDAGIPPHHIQTMHHMADIPMFDLPHDHAWLCREFNWPEDTSIVVGAARLDPDKGFVQLLKAFAIVHQQMPKTRLLIAGQPSPGTDHHLLIKQTATDLGLNNVVTFAGYRTDLPKIFAGMDVFCQPVQHDASSLVFLGAMVARAPVVSVRSGSVPEVIVDGETGLLSDVGDIDSLANNLLKVLQDKELATQLGCAGRERVENVFGPQVIAHDWAEKLYRRFRKQETRPSQRRKIIDSVFGLCTVVGVREMAPILAEIGVLYAQVF